MRFIKIWWVGGATGAIVGLLVLLATQALSIDGSLELSELGIALIAPSVVAVFMAKVTKSKVVPLLIIGYLTAFVPVLPALFGAPNSDFKVVASIALLGLSGGLVWGAPFVLWTYVRQKKVD